VAGRSDPAGGLGLRILAALGAAFVVIVLTLYFLASLDSVKHGLYRLAPASRRQRVEGLGDRILEGIGDYVSGAFVVAVCAGLSSLIFLFVVGLGQYAVALAVVVAILDVIPMIGATLGAVIVSAIGLGRRTDRDRLHHLLPDLPAGDVEVRGHPGCGHRDRRPDRGQPARRHRRPARNPHRRRDPPSRPRGVHPQAGHTVAGSLHELRTGGTQRSGCGTGSSL
jgi:hypothetical protein